MTASATEQQPLGYFVEMRPKTDYSISTKWFWFAVANYVTWTAMPFLPFFDGALGEPLASTLTGILGLAGFVFSAGSAYLVYLLVNRRNNHLAREEALMWKTLRDLRAKTSPTDLKTMMPLSSAEQSLARLDETAKERSAILWGVLTLIPYLGWVFVIFTLSFLNRDFEKHEWGEDIVVEDLGRALKAQGGTDVIPRRIRAGGRNTVVYVLLSIFTGGIFLLGWLFLATEDPEPHFQYHRYFEDTIAQTLQGSTSIGSGVA